MNETPNNTGQKSGSTRFQRGNRANPNGRPVGSRNKISLAVEALGAGELTPNDAGAVVAVIDGYRKMLELTEIERRLAALEREK